MCKLYVDNGLYGLYDVCVCIYIHRVMIYIYLVIIYISSYYIHIVVSYLYSHIKLYLVYASWVVYLVTTLIVCGFYLHHCHVAGISSLAVWPGLELYCWPIRWTVDGMPSLGTQFANLQLFWVWSARFFLSPLATPFASHNKRLALLKFRCVGHEESWSHQMGNFVGGCWVPLLLGSAAAGFRCRVLLGKERGPKLVGLPSL